MWTATRNSTTARTDEDAAMAYVNYGSYVERKDARKALLDAIRVELNHFIEQPNPQYFSVSCIMRLATILKQLLPEDATKGEYEGLRFQIREYNASK